MYSQQLPQQYFSPSRQHQQYNSQLIQNPSRNQSSQHQQYHPIQQQQPNQQHYQYNQSVNLINQINSNLRDNNQHKPANSVTSIPYKRKILEQEYSMQQQYQNQENELLNSLRRQNNVGIDKENYNTINNSDNKNIFALQQPHSVRNDYTKQQQQPVSQSQFNKPQIFRDNIKNPTNNNNMYNSSNLPPILKQIPENKSHLIQSQFFQKNSNEINNINSNSSNYSQNMGGQSLNLQQIQQQQQQQQNNERKQSSSSRLNSQYKHQSDNFYSKNIQTQNQNQNQQQQNIQTNNNNVQQQQKESEYKKKKLDNLDKNDSNRNFKLEDHPNYTNKEVSFLQKMDKYYQGGQSSLKDDITQADIEKLEKEYAASHQRNKLNDKYEDHFNQMSKEKYLLLDFKDRPDYKKNLLRYQNSLKRNDTFQNSSQIIQEVQKDRRMLGYNIISNHNVLYKNQHMPQNPQKESLNVVIPTSNNPNKFYNQSQEISAPNLDLYQNSTNDNKNNNNNGVIKNKLIDKQYIGMPNPYEHRQYFMNLYDQENSKNRHFQRKAIISNNAVNEY